MRECTLPLTGRRVIDRVITELAVFDFVDGPASGRPREMVLIEHAPGVSLDDIRAATSAKFRVSDDIRSM